MTALPMTSRAVNLRAEPSPGDSVLIRGNRYVVLERLPSLPGRPPAARVTPTCRAVSAMTRCSTTTRVAVTASPAWSLDGRAMPAGGASLPSGLLPMGLGPHGPRRDGAVGAWRPFLLTGMFGARYPADPAATGRI